MSKFTDINIDVKALIKENEILINNHIIKKLNLNKYNYSSLYSIFFKYYFLNNYFLNLSKVILIIFFNIFTLFIRMSLIIII